MQHFSLFSCQPVRCSHPLLRSGMICCCYLAHQSWGFSPTLVPLFFWGKESAARVCLRLYLLFGFTICPFAYVQKGWLGRSPVASLPALCKHLQTWGCLKWPYVFIFRQTNYAVTDKVIFHFTLSSSRSPRVTLHREILWDSCGFQLAQVELSGRLWSQAACDLESRDWNPEQEEESDNRSLCRIWAGAQWSPVPFLLGEA